MRPLKDLILLPGLHTLDTDRVEGMKGRWKDGDKVRFKDGLPQKLGGWSKVSSNTFLGLCRGMFDWLTLSFEKFVAVGTHLKLYAWKGGTFYDVTPVRTSVTLGADPFTTANGSATVTVTHASHGALINDFVIYDGASTFNGVTIDGEYQVVEVLNANSYRIVHSVAASGTGAGGGGAVEAEYQINTGAEHSVYGLGWGAGAWGQSTWGEPRVISNFFATARVWSLDNWGEDLIANPRGKGIYLWDASVGTGTRAAEVSGAPSTAKSIMVSPEGQHLIVFGAHTGSADDPLLIRWSDSEDYSEFTASSTTSAGQKRLNTGNEILGGIRGRGEIVVMTDSNLWSMTYIGPTDIFAFSDKGSNGGIRGQNAMIEVDGIIYWMGEKAFYYYDGAIHILPCDVWPTVFDDLNFAQRVKTYCGFNRDFGEVWWFYCSAESNEVNRYVMHNRQDKTWSFGALVRTAFIGDSDLFSLPFAAGSDGFLYEHEIGVDADGAAMEASLQSGDVGLGEGEFLMRIGMFVPDFKTLVGNVSLTLVAKKYPQSGAGKTTTKGPFTISPTTEYINPKIKGRQISLALQSSAIGDNWRMGQPRVGLKPHGKK